MPKIDPEFVEKIWSFVVDAISVQFPSDFAISSNTVNNKWTRITIVFGENVAAFASKTVQNDSKWIELFHLFFFVFFAICVLFEPFWSQNFGKHSTKIEFIIQ